MAASLQHKNLMCPISGHGVRSVRGRGCVPTHCRVKPMLRHAQRRPDLGPVFRLSKHFRQCSVVLGPSYTNNDTFSINNVSRKLFV